jgi:DNA-binding MarR family transcriptional regulator
MTRSFIDTHPLAGAFVANQLERLAALIVAQGDTLLEEAGVSVPARAVSAVVLIGERGGMAVADIAKTLERPHQLVTQRIDLLIELGIVRRVDDPGDGRRKIVVLTAKGSEQYRRLGASLVRAKAAFAGLFKEIECDLPAAVLRTMEALERLPLANRAVPAKRVTV